MEEEEDSFADVVVHRGHGRSENSVATERLQLRGTCTNHRLKVKVRSLWLGHDASCFEGRLRLP